MKLKTLKDKLKLLYKELEKLNIEIGEKKSDDDHIALMMVHSEVCGKIRALEESRQEAIRWVKEFRKHPTNSIGEIEFMNFSNITEEDLK